RRQRGEVEAGGDVDVCRGSRAREHPHRPSGVVDVVPIEAGAGCAIVEARQAVVPFDPKPRTRPFRRERAEALELGAEVGLADRGGGHRCGHPAPSSARTHTHTHTHVTRLSFRGTARNLSWVTGLTRDSSEYLGMTPCTPASQ